MQIQFYMEGDYNKFIKNKDQQDYFRKSLKHAIKLSFHEFMGENYDKWKQNCLR